MTPRRARLALALATLVAAAGIGVATPARATAASLLTPVCKVLDHLPVPDAVGCKVAASGLTAGRQLAAGTVAGATSGGIGGAVTSGVGGAASGVLGGAVNGIATIGFGAVASLAADSARYALDQTAGLIEATTTPQLQAPWFTRVYWRLAGISIVLTLPCLFAAAVQSLIRSDLGLLARAAFGYLPAAMLAVGVGAQLTALVLAATDGLCDLVSGVAGHAAPAFLTRAGEAVVALSLASHSPFLAFVVAGFTVAGAIVLWLELMMREAAVYVVVAMLPLAFAAFVWPARRAWALRAVELLAALILAKLAMVTVLTLGGAALASSPKVTGYLAGLVLLTLGAFAPWAMLRMLPLAELAGSAAGRLRAESGVLAAPDRLASGAIDAAVSTASRLRGGGARAAAEDVMARMRRDDPRTPDTAAASDPGGDPLPEAGAPLADAAADATFAAGEADPAIAAPAPDDAPQQPTEATPRAADPKPQSIYEAPDFSWPLELSTEANWSDAPPWTRPKPAPDGVQPSATANDRAAGAPDPACAASDAVAAGDGGGGVHPPPADHGADGLGDTDSLGNPDGHSGPDRPTGPA